MLFWPQVLREEEGDLFVFAVRDGAGVVRLVLAEIGGHRQLGGDVSVRGDGPHDRGVVKADLAVGGVANLELYETLDLVFELG